MNTKELEIDKLEAEFPFLSSLAFSREREKTLAAGSASSKRSRE
ncbi:hypothetical protein [Verrucomicrobium spinosum]|nr:hypothetical protein [Verrucomicrobium spinosum]